jgi:hypothetical protein
VMRRRKKKVRNMKELIINRRSSFLIPIVI